MPKAISKGTLLPLFADDLKCFQVILGCDDDDKLQDDVNKLVQRSCILGVDFNAKKCKVQGCALGEFSGRPADVQP